MLAGIGRCLLKELFFLKILKMKRIALPVLCGLAALAVCCQKGEKPGTDVEISEIVITYPESHKLVLAQGETARIKYSVIPESMESQAVIEWSIDNPDIAKVRNGRVEAISEGKAVVTASCGKVSTDVRLTVTPVAVTGFSVPSSLTALVGIPLEIETTVEPEGTNASSLTWTVSDSDIASVYVKSGIAYVEGISEGSTTITVSYEGLEDQTINLNCIMPENSVVLSYGAGILKDDSIISVSDISLLTEEGYPYISMRLYPKAEISSKALKVTSSNEDFCTCSLDLSADPTEARIIMDNKDNFGSSDISVIYGDVTRSFTLVREAQGIPGEILVLSQGKKFTQGSSSKIVLDSEAEYSISTGHEVKWSSSDPSILEIYPDDNGWHQKVKILAAGEGEAQITVTDQTGKTMSFTLVVSKQWFDSKAYVYVESTGYTVEEDKVYYNLNTFVLSNPEYRGVWSLEDDSCWDLEINGNGNSATVRVKSGCKGKYSSNTTLTVSDQAGLTSFSIKIGSAVTFNTKSRIVQSGEGPEVSHNAIKILWKGSQTKYQQSFKLYNSGEYVGLNGLEMKIVKTRTLSGSCAYTAEQEEIWKRNSFSIKWDSIYEKEVEIKLVSPVDGSSVSRKLITQIDTRSSWKIKQIYTGGKLTWTNKTEPISNHLTSLYELYKLTGSDGNDWGKYYSFELYYGDDTNSKYAVTNVPCLITYYGKSERVNLNEVNKNMPTYITVEHSYMTFKIDPDVNSHEFRITF